MCIPFRNGAFDAIKSAAALRLSPCLCVLRCLERLKDLRDHPTAEFAKRRLFNKCYDFAAVGAVQLSPAEAVLSAMKLPKKGGARLSGVAAKANTTGTPPGGPKSR